MALTIAGDNLESTNLTLLDATPVTIATEGEGAPYRVKQNDDFIVTTTAIVSSSVYRLGPRIPTNARIKAVTIYAKGVDSNSTATAAADINLIFSDAPVGGLAAGSPVLDGTPVSNANLIPTSALTGATTTIATYASPNKMFGAAYLLVGNSAAAKTTDITFLNSFTPQMAQQPLWKALGYTQDPGGFVDFFVVMTANAATAAAGVIYIRATYSV